MTHSIIGFGKIGHALARAFARSGVPVSVATTRDPASFAADAAAVGSGVRAATLADAVKADLVFLAVRFEAHAEVAESLPDWHGRIVVDVTNPWNEGAAHGHRAQHQDR